MLFNQKFGQDQAFMVFNERFMQKYTKFKNIEEFLRAAGVKDVSEFLKPSPAFEKFIKENTSFKSFHAMLQKAGQEYLKKTR